MMSMLCVTATPRFQIKVLLGDIRSDRWVKVEYRGYSGGYSGWLRSVFLMEEKAEIRTLELERMERCYPDEAYTSAKG